VVHGGAGSGASDRTVDLARSVDRDRRKALLGVEQWEEIRRMKHVEGLSQREIRRRTGIHRDTIRRSLASSEPPGYGPRPPRTSMLDAFVGTIEEVLAETSRGCRGCASARSSRRSGIGAARRSR
jgi:hypothetical protein